MTKLALFLSASLMLSAQEDLLEEISFSDAIVTTPMIDLGMNDFALPAPEVVIPKRKSPGMAVFLSTLLPGLGHYYIGENRVGSELLAGATVSGVGMYLSSDDANLEIPSLMTLQAVSSYGIFSVYRDTLRYNGETLPHMPKENFTDLLAAPFQWSVMKKPEVWGGILGSLTIASTVAYFAYSDLDGSIHKDTKYVMPLTAIPVAISEESLFRGFVQSGLLRNMSPVSAITISSLTFGLAHIPNAYFLEEEERQRYYSVSLPLITGLGAYMGWLANKNHSLKEAVAMHMWYDFTLFCLGALKPAVVQEPKSFSFNLTF